MNYIKEAEQYLKYYADLHKSIENMDKEIARLIYRSVPKGSTSSVLDLTGIRGNNNQDDAYNTLFKIQNLIKSKANTEEELEKIDKILEDISQEKDCEYYGQVLRKWYIERIPKEDIAREIGYSSKRSVYSLRSKAIRKFAIRLFGLEALKIV